MLTIAKTYTGSLERLLTPDTNTFAGVSGDNNATTLKFTFPATHTSYVKQVRFNIRLKDANGNIYFPIYTLKADNTIAIPLEVSAVGGSMSFTVIFSNNDATVVEESRPSTIFFQGPNHVDTYILADDIESLLANGFVTAAYSVDTTLDRPIITFTSAGGSTTVLTLEEPYLTNGKIPSTFLPDQSSATLWSVTAVADLTGLTSAKKLDFALLTPTDGSLQTLYLMIGTDPTVADSWFKVKPTTKSEVGLGNVDNTSDLDKPISTATQSALDAVNNSITQESTARTSADDALQVKITANTTAISAESTARTDADTALDGKISANASAITAESNARVSADNALDTKIGANTTAINAETTARTDADTALDTKISANATAISTETADRTSADNAINSALSAHIANHSNPHQVTTSQIGAVAVAQGTANANKSLIVGTDGNVTTGTHLDVYSTTVTISSSANMSFSINSGFAKICSVSVRDSATNQETIFINSVSGGTVIFSGEGTSDGESSFIVDVIGYKE